MLRDKNSTKKSSGFTLIELLVVVAIISLLSSIALIAYQSARAKSRNAKRLADMAQMNTALELYFAANKGYPSSTNGVPLSLTPQYASTLPQAPMPADGVCDGLAHGSACSDADPNCANIAANIYYYTPVGQSFLNGPGGFMVYPSYSYYFCLGAQTGNFGAGERVLTPTGLK